MLTINSVDSEITETYQNFTLQREPYYFQERLALANGKDIGTIDPLPVLNGTSVSATLVCELLTGRGDDRRSIAGLGLGSTNPQSTGGVGGENNQKSPDSTGGLEGPYVLGVDEGGEMVRLEDEGGGANGLVLTLLLVRVAGVDGRARVGWCGGVESVVSVIGGSDGGDHVGGRVKLMINCGIISSGCRIQRSSGMRVYKVRGRLDGES